MTDSEVDNLIETPEENANPKNKRLVQEIVFLLFHPCLYNIKNITYPLVGTNFNVLVFKSMFHSFAALTREIST